MANEKNKNKKPKYEIKAQKADGRAITNRLSQVSPAIAKAEERARDADRASRNN